MKWEKKGLLSNCTTIDLDWYKKNTMCPLPYKINENTIRLFLAFCDENNYGRLGYLDLDIENPANILAYSKTPILDVGELGSFDEHGILPASLIKENNDLYMFYTAYQKQISVPYSILSGLALSKDNGETFFRTSNAPILDRINGELHQRSAAEIMKKDGVYKIWYTANIGWIDNGIHTVPKYDIKFLQSDNLFKWDGTPIQSLALKDDEYGLTTPQVFFENGIYKMYYSVRSISKGYRLGYAESEDGITFERMDEKMEIDVSEYGFDSEMICFGKIFKHGSRTYLFYCGNHYGVGGVGYAELVK